MSTSSQPPTPPQLKTGMAIASIVLGVMGMFCFGPLTLIPAVILAHIAYSRAKKQPQEYGGEGIALAGIIVGYSGFLVFIFIFGIQMAILLPALARAREAALKASCANNQKMLALEFQMYAEDHDGAYPPLSSTPNRLVPDDASLQNYSEDPSIMICPSDLSAPDPTLASVAELFDDHSYFYLGFALINDEYVAEFADYYRDTIATGGGFENDVQTYKADDSPGITLLRLRRDLGPYEDDGLTASTVPILIERPEHHFPPGGNVVYLDGHVEYIEYPGRWPMTVETISTLEELAGPG